MTPANIALIGGTGFERLPPDIYAEAVQIQTSQGEVNLLSISDNYIEPDKLYFLSRHGQDHHLAPHEIDYRANIEALTKLGVEYVLATNAVGSLRLDMPPGTFVLLSDFIDFTRHRSLTYFPAEQWQHVDFSIPYDPEIREAILQSAKKRNMGIVPNATYLCCDGPRFESPAEIKMFSSWGADIVGMTGIPEAIFAREAGMKYASLGLVTNYGAGLTQNPVEHTQVVARMASHTEQIKELLLESARCLYGR